MISTKIEILLVLFFKYHNISLVCKDMQDVCFEEIISLILDRSGCPIGDGIDLEEIEESIQKRDFHLDNINVLINYLSERKRLNRFTSGQMCEFLKSIDDSQKYEFITIATKKELLKTIINKDHLQRIFSNISDENVKKRLVQYFVYDYYAERDANFSIIIYLIEHVPVQFGKDRSIFLISFINMHQDIVSKLNFFDLKSIEKDLIYLFPENTENEVKKIMDEIDRIQRSVKIDISPPSRGVLISCIAPGAIIGPGTVINNATASYMTINFEK